MKSERLIKLIVDGVNDVVAHHVRHSSEAVENHDVLTPEEADALLTGFAGLIDRFVIRQKAKKAAKAAAKDDNGKDVDPSHLR